MSSADNMKLNIFVVLTMSFRMAIRDAAIAPLATLRIGQVVDTRAADAVHNENRDESFGDGETDATDAVDRDADTPEN